MIWGFIKCLSRWSYNEPVAKWIKLRWYERGFLSILFDILMYQSKKIINSWRNREICLPLWTSPVWSGNERKSIKYLHECEIKKTVSCQPVPIKRWRLYRWNVSQACLIHVFFVCPIQRWFRAISRVPVFPAFIISFNSWYAHAVPGHCRSHSWASLFHPWRGYRWRSRSVELYENLECDTNRCRRWPQLMLYVFWK